MQEAKAIEMAKQRVRVTTLLMLVIFVVIAGRLADVMLWQSSKKIGPTEIALLEGQSMPRADIYDRNGNVLATHLITASVYAEPKTVINAKDAAQKLASLFPEVGFKTLKARLSSEKGFIWLARHISPKMQKAVNELGLPGVYLRKDYKRVYPYGSLLSHVLGYCGLENTGLAGVEKFFDTSLAEGKNPLRLSLDVRIQHIVKDVLVNAISEFKAQGANAMVMDLKTGQILAMVSAPDFNPHQVGLANQQALFNRNTLGVYEPGSTWKILNTAIAIETGTATPRSAYDASAPIKIGRFKITDFRGKNRVLNLTEAFVYSSNIAAIKVAQQFGIQNQKAYFKKFGVLEPIRLELPEIGSPLTPREWREPTLMTASYGYGISVTPLQILTVVASIINDGIKVKPTLLNENDDTNKPDALGSQPPQRIVGEKTSRIVREMMRMTSLYGGSRKADSDGYEVFAKTGTAYQSRGKSGYNGKERTTTCVGAFPFHDPQVAVIVMLDAPQATKETYNYATAGWNAAPTLGKLINRIAPMLGISPHHEESEMKYVHWYEGTDSQPKVVQTTHVRE